MSSRPRKRKCQCGGNLNWERSNGKAWMALCDQEDCGHLTFPLSQREELEAFLGTGARPLLPPWTRMFLRAASVEGLRWIPADCPCSGCKHVDLNFKMYLWPNSQLNSVEMCIGCGSLITRHLNDRGRASEIHGGTDWATPDAAVMTFRKGLREREAAKADDEPADPWNFPSF
jgi:hypothetical protein